MTCKHLIFSAEVKVARIEDTGRFLAEVRIACKDCDTPFQFAGMQTGFNYNHPTVSLDGLHANLPIFANGQQPNPLQRLMGYSVSNTN